MSIFFYMYKIYLHMLHKISNEQYRYGFSPSLMLSEVAKASMNYVYFLLIICDILENRLSSRHETDISGYSLPVAQNTARISGYIRRAISNNTVESFPPDHEI